MPLELALDFSALALYDVVLYCDDSGSMAFEVQVLWRWEGGRVFEVRVWWWGEGEGDTQRLERGRGGAIEEAEGQGAQQPDFVRAQTPGRSLWFV
jgi:hypothetical protein